MNNGKSIDRYCIWVILQICVVKFAYASYQEQNINHC